MPTDPRPDYSTFRPARRLYPTLALAPDGSGIAYVDDSTGQFNVTTQTMDAPTGTTLTSFVDQTVRRVAWHPSGAFLVLEADDGGTENTQIYRVDPAGGDPATGHRTASI